jgi:hypothetical protein
LKVKDLQGTCHEAIVQGRTLKVECRIFTPQQFWDMGFTIEDCTEEEQSALEKLGIHEQCAK